ncbi:MAG: type II toxin-antitoxin system HicB family antitoxin [Thermoanaerobaculia bacterium]
MMLGAAWTLSCTLTAPPAAPVEKSSGSSLIGTWRVVAFEDRETGQGAWDHPLQVGTMTPMQRINIVYWEEEGGWMGYLQEYPDYWTQGDSLDDLKEHLKDLYQDIAMLNKDSR